ncbi:MAG: choice-of-anchor D domain-containing protein [Bacteroidetes bacterium]|nr:choice-of-anchor D domain-containing protein [Bacteroidota bacterium]
MQKIRAIIFLLLCCVPFWIVGQNVIVSGALTGNGSYPTVGAAFSAINAGAQNGANIVVEVSANTTEPSSAVLNQGTWLHLALRPSGGVARSITGNLAGPLVDLNGADRVTIDGLNSGGNALTIENQNTTTASTLRFINDARNVLVQNCSLLGANTDANMGTVFLSTSAGNGGNDSITVSNCIISASGANFPINGILSIGTATAGQENSAVSILNTQIRDFFHPSLGTNGLWAADGNTRWTVSGCRFFQSAYRTYTIGEQHRAIRITAGDGHLISANVIGYRTATGTGSYRMYGNVSTEFRAIDLAVGSNVATSVQGNQIKSFQMTTASLDSSQVGAFCGINLAVGKFLVGTITGNTIGTPAVAPIGIPDTIHVSSVAGPTLTTGIHCASEDSVILQNNRITGIMSFTFTPHIGGAFTGIAVDSTAPYLKIQGNMIGDTVIYNTFAGGNGPTIASTYTYGIHLRTMPEELLIDNNNIRGLGSFGIGAKSFLYGISTPLSADTSTVTISNNQVQNLYSTSGNDSYLNGLASLVAIYLGTGNNPIVRNNRIRWLQCGGSGNGNSGSAIGIAVAGGIQPQIYSNVIDYFRNDAAIGLSWSPSVVAGIMVGANTVDPSILNNMICFGYFGWNDMHHVGIWMPQNFVQGNSTAHILHNTVYITQFTNFVATLPSFGFLRGNLIPGNTITARVDFRNNLIHNTRNAGSTSNYAIADNFDGTSSAIGWISSASDNNVLNVTNPTQVGWWNGDRTLADWRGYSNGDFHSVSATPVNFVSLTGNWHLNMGTTPTPIESGGQLISSVLVDIDTQTRPGPSVSVNGGGLFPDIGADEIDGVYSDASPPSISHTPITRICNTADYTFQATISDVTGVPTAGGLRPKVYFRKNAGAYVSAPGTLVSGNGINGTWSFTISNSAMGGVVIADSISYFVIAQDLATIPNLIAKPALGFVATNVNTVSSPPSSPYKYVIGDNLSGTYSIGVGGDFTTLTAAVNRYNISCLNGPILFSLIDASYPAETFPITVLNNVDASTMNTLTIKPATGVSPSIVGSNAQAILRFHLARYVTLDGSNSPNGSTRDLTVRNNSTGLSNAVIWLSSPEPVDGTDHITIKNCTVRGSSPTTSRVCIVSSGIYVGSLGGRHINTVIENNHLFAAQFGVTTGQINIGNPGVVITRNQIGSTNLAESISGTGINVYDLDGGLVTDNNIFNIGGPTSYPPKGIDINGRMMNTRIERNRISGIKSTQVNGPGAIGILVNNNLDVPNFVIANNFISDITCFGKTTMGYQDNSYGICSYGGRSADIVHNTILMNTNQTSPTSNSAGIWNFTTFGSQPVNIHNNIIVSTQTVGAQRYALYSFSPVPPAFGTMDNNCLSTLGPNLARKNSTNYVDLAATQIGFGGNANSITAVPVFLNSPPDLHLLQGSNPGITNGGAYLPAVPYDIDGETRNTLAPNIGADEFPILGPEINILGNNISILDGDNSPSLSDSTDFGDILTCTPFATRTFTVQNLSNNVLNISSTNITGPHASDFGLIVPLPSSIASNASANFSIRFTPSALGIRTATITVSSDDVDEGSYDFAIQGTQIADTTAPTAICQAVTVNLDSSGNGATTAAAVNNGSTDDCAISSTSLSQTSFSCSQVGPNTVTLIVTDATGNSSSCSAIVHVVAAAVTGSIQADTAQCGYNISCAGANDGVAHATGIGGCPGYTYLWSTGATTSTATGLGPGTVTVTITDAAGGTSVQTVNLTTPSTLQAGANTWMSCFTNPTGEIDITPQGGNSCQPYGYLWSNGDTTEDLFNVAAGNYTLTISDAAGCFFTSTVTVAAFPALNPMVSQAGNTLTAVLTWTTYQWLLNGNTILGATANSFTPTVSGSYSLQVTDTNGCSGVSDTTNITIVGIADHMGDWEELTIFPNPTRNEFRLLTMTPIGGAITLDIQDMYGRHIFSRALSGLASEVAFDIKALSAGTYMVQVTSETGQRKLFRLVVQ